MNDVKPKKIHLFNKNCLPIKPPIRKQTICATIKSITSTESFLPLRFSIMVPCIFLYSHVLHQCLESRLTYAKIFETYRRRNRSDRRGRGQTDADKNKFVFRHRGGLSRWKPPLPHKGKYSPNSRGIREISNFEISNSRSSRFISRYQCIDIAKDSSVSANVANFTSRNTSSCTSATGVT